MGLKAIGINIYGGGFTLGVREALRLCSYPDSFIIHRPIEAIDAVLPAVSDFLGLTAKKTILRAEEQEKTFEVIDWRPLAKPFHFKKS